MLQYRLRILPTADLEIKETERGRNITIYFRKKAVGRLSTVLRKSYLLLRIIKSENLSLMKSMEAIKKTLVTINRRWLKKL